MRVMPTAIADVLVFEPTVFDDARGLFFESFNLREFTDAVQQSASNILETPWQFVQDNHSQSLQNVLRGLHYQIRQPQGKLVRVIDGEVFDVAVDIRANSVTFGKWVGTILSSENRRQVWIPPGFAHGFLTCSARAQVLYKTTDYFAPEHQRCIAWNDSTINIDWPCEGKPILSERDLTASSLLQAEVFS